MNAALVMAVSLLAAGGPPGPEPTLDEEFAAVALEEPAFAGAYIEQGVVQIALTNPSRSEHARAALERQLGRERRDALRGRPHAAVRAQFGWGELFAWSSAIQNVFSFPAVRTVDIDEKRNRIVVGVDDLSVVPQLEAFLLSVNVPLAAVAFEQDAGFVETATLSTWLRPAPGGAQIAWSISASTYGLCTLGFGVRDASGNVAFVTNGHCADNGLGSTAGGEAMFQPLVGSGYSIGSEWVDPAARLDLPGCPGSYPCRASDSMLVLPSDAVQLGAIARPTAIGSLTIDAARPVFTIKGERGGSPLAGEDLHRVGRTSGWQHGTVSSTCMNLVPGGRSYMLLCQSSFLAYSDHGDSGSPVFSFPDPASWGDGVILRGIQWGGSSDNTLVVYSPLANVEQDLGALNTCESGWTDTCVAGSCTNVTSDPLTCGSCGNVCSGVLYGSAACLSGTCGATCNPGTRYTPPTGACTSCNGRCMYTQSDPLNCGACGNACPTIDNGYPKCIAGSCQYDCKDGFKFKW